MIDINDICSNNGAYSYSASVDDSFLYRFDIATIIREFSYITFQNKALSIIRNNYL